MMCFKEGCVLPYLQPAITKNTTTIALTQKILVAAASLERAMVRPYRNSTGLDSNFNLTRTFSRRARQHDEFLIGIHDSHSGGRL
jgi:hypothetical protein